MGAPFIGPGMVFYDNLISNILLEVHSLCMISEIKVLFVRILKCLVFFYFYIVSFWLPIWYVVDLARQSSKPPETWFCHGSWFRKSLLPSYYLSNLASFILWDSVKLICTWLTYCLWCVFLPKLSRFLGYIALCS